jgi:hypothetical protein
MTLPVTRVDDDAIHRASQCLAADIAIFGRSINHVATNLPTGAFSALARQVQLFVEAQRGYCHVVGMLPEMQRQLRA